MCGIAGIITTNKDHQISDMMLADMSTALHHRGPDSRGSWISSDNSIGLAHTRLAIHDLSPAGHQPMQSASRRHTIIFNGEIYNFLHLRSQLESENIQFSGKSDTEVLLAGIEHWGLTKTLEKAEGMFAIALWDQYDRTLHLARDRVGEKPLYLALANRTIAFASQLSAITKLPFVRKDISNEAVRQFLTYGYIPTPYSIYENVFKLVPGTYISIKHEALNSLSPQKMSYENICKHFQSTRYWDLPAIANSNLQQQVHDESQNLNTLTSLLEETVRDQMISDVPYGAFLSGGIDSSLVVSIMQSISSDPVNTFTIGFHNKRFDEATYAKQISKHLGTEHHELYVSEGELLDIIPKLHLLYDEPFADPSQIPTCLVCSMARQYVTVALSGDGGDELFGGYNRYRMLNLWKIKQHIPSFARRHAIYPALSLYKRLSNDSSGTFVRLFNKNQGPQTSTSSVINKIEHIMKSDSFKDAYRYMLTLTDNIDQYIADKSEEVTKNEFLKGELGLDEFSSMLLWDQQLYLTDDNLVKVDRASMASSLETRHPLINHKIIEYSWKIPQSYKMTKSSNKVILKNILSQYLPSTLIERPKMGFSVPIKEWLLGPLSDWGNDLLNLNTISSYGILNPTSTVNSWQAFKSHSNTDYLLLWRLLVLQNWLAHTR